MLTIFICWQTFIWYGANLYRIEMHCKLQNLIVHRIIMQWFINYLMICLVLRVFISIYSYRLCLKKFQRFFETIFVLNLFFCHLILFFFAYRGEWQFTQVMHTWPICHGRQCKTIRHQKIDSMMWWFTCAPLNFHFVQWFFILILLK